MRAQGLPAYIHAGNLLQPPRPQRPATAPPALAAQVGFIWRITLPFARHSAGQPLTLTAVHLQLAELAAARAGTTRRPPRAPIVTADAARPGFMPGSAIGYADLIAN